MLVPAWTFPKMVTRDVIDPPLLTPIGLGANVTETPVGTIPLVRATLPVKPPRLDTVSRSDPELPAGIDREDAVAVRLKSEVDVTAAPVSAEALCNGSGLEARTIKVTRASDSDINRRFFFKE